MATIEYSVTGQKITTTATTDPLVKGTIGEYDVAFTFDSAWDTFDEKWAVFDPDNGDPWKQPLDDGACEFPGEVMWANSVIIGVYGVKDGVEFPTIWASRLWFKDGANVPADVSDYPEPSPVLAKLVSTDPQTFTDEQKAQARENIDALGKIEGTEGHITIIGSNNNITDGGMSIDEILTASDGLYNVDDASTPIYVRENGDTKYAQVHRLGGMTSYIFNWIGSGSLNFTSDTEYVNGVKFINNGDMSYTIDVAEGGCTAEVTKQLRTSTTRPTNYKGHVWLMHLFPDDDILFDYVSSAGSFTDWFQSTSAIKTGWYARTVVSSPAYRYFTISVSAGCPKGTYTVYPQFIDLTMLFGVGNEPIQNGKIDNNSAVWDAITSYGIDPRLEYYPYVSGGSHISSVPTGISVLNASDEVVQHIEIPQEVLALEGYGQSNFRDITEYNYIDFDRLKYVQVGYEEDDSWIDESAEVDISAYIPKTPILTLPTGGKLRVDQSQTPKVLPNTEITFKIARHLVDAESIAYVQDDYTAVQPYEVNDLVYVGNTLYIVTSAIAQGATMTPSTNCAETTLNAVIKSLR